MLSQQDGSGHIADLIVVVFGSILIYLLQSIGVFIAFKSKTKGFPHKLVCHCDRIDAR